MRTQMIALSVALISGAFLAAQVAVNAELRRRVGDPTIAAIISFVIGMAALLAAALVQRPTLPEPSAVLAGPWWIWLGGVLGAAYITAAAALSGRLGAAGWLATVIAGQILTALLLDHQGWLGLTRQPISASKVLGALLLLIGVALVLRR